MNNLMIKIILIYFLFSILSLAQDVKLEYYIGDNNKAGYRNEKTKEILIPAKFDYAGDFQNGEARVQIGNKWGLIDTLGNFIIPANYDDIGHTNEGKVVVSLNDKWGIVDCQNKVVIPIEYYGVSNYSNNISNAMTFNNIIYSFNQNGIKTDSINLMFEKKRLLKPYEVSQKTRKYREMNRYDCLEYFIRNSYDNLKKVNIIISYGVDKDYGHIPLVLKEGDMSCVITSRYESTETILRLSGHNIYSALSLVVNVIKISIESIEIERNRILINYNSGWPRIEIKNINNVIEIIEDSSY